MVTALEERQAILDYLNSEANKLGSQSKTDLSKLQQDILDGKHLTTPKQFIVVIVPDSTGVAGAGSFQIKEKTFFEITVTASDRSQAVTIVNDYLLTNPFGSLVFTIGDVFYFDPYGRKIEA